MGVQQLLMLYYAIKRVLLILFKLIMVLNKNTLMSAMFEWKMRAFLL